MRCAPGTIYYGNALCDYDRSQPEPAPNPDDNNNSNLFNYSNVNVHFIPPVTVEYTHNLTYWHGENHITNGQQQQHGQQMVNNGNEVYATSTLKSTIQLNNGEIRNDGNNDVNPNFVSSSTVKSGVTTTRVSSDLTTRKEQLNSINNLSSNSVISTSSFMSSIRYTPSYIPSRSSVYYITTKSNKNNNQNAASQVSSSKFAAVSTLTSTSTVSSTLSKETASSSPLQLSSSTSASSLTQENKTPECKSEAEVLVKTNKPAVVPCNN